MGMIWFYAGRLQGAYIFGSSALDIHSSGTSQTNSSKSIIAFQYHRFSKLPPAAWFEDQKFFNYCGKLVIGNAYSMKAPIYHRRKYLHGLQIGAAGLP